MDNSNVQQQQLQQQLMQQHKSNKRYFAVIILLLLVLGLTVGYAVLSASFNINGTSTITNTTWEIGVGDSDIVCPTGTVCTINPDNPEALTPDDGTTNGSIIWIDGNTVYFKHLLTKPGDVFTFTTTYTNSGSIDAKVSSVTTSSLNATAQRFMDYEVTYEDGSTIRQGDVLSAGDSATFKVTVGYRSTVTVLPTSEELALINETNDGHTGAVSLFSVTYEQA